MDLLLQIQDVVKWYVIWHSPIALWSSAKAKVVCVILYSEQSFTLQQNMCVVNVGCFIIVHCSFDHLFLLAFSFHCFANAYTRTASSPCASFRVPFSVHMLAAASNRTTHFARLYFWPMDFQMHYLINSQVWLQYEPLQTDWE